MSKFVSLFVVILPTVLACQNANLGSYKLHNGQGEMSYMDKEKSSLYSEQGIWVSWKVPVPKHWDPKTGQLRTESPGRTIGKDWNHWNQLQDENPPMKKPTPEEIAAASFRVSAPDPYREYLRQNQEQPSVNDGLFFLSAGTADQDTNTDTIKGHRPNMPAAYMGALLQSGYNKETKQNPEVEAAGSGVGAMPPKSKTVE